jgi:hypothetical protein
MKVTIPHEHVQDLRFALAEQVERDEDLIRQAEDDAERRHVERPPAASLLSRPGQPVV